MAVVTKHRKNGKVALYVKLTFQGREIWEPAGRDEREARRLNTRRLREIRGE